MKRRTLKLLLLAAFALFIFSKSHAQEETLKKGWESFNKNKRKEAKAFFLEASQISSTKSEAFLALSLVSWSEKNKDESFKYFSEFYNASENPFPHTYALWSSCLDLNTAKKTQEKIKFLNNIIKNPKADGTLKAMAHASLGMHYASINNFQKANEEYGMQNTIDKWQMVGEFYNTSGSGFNKNFGPLSHPESNAEFFNAYDAKVKWFTPPTLRSDKWVDFEYHFNAVNFIIYAQTFIESPQEQQVQLRTGVSGSLKLWLNDALVDSVSEERNTDLDVYNSKVKLNKGFNRILIQIGNSDISRSNFMIRITDQNGNAITGLNVLPTFQNYTSEKTITAEKIPFAPEEYFKKQIKEQEEKIVNYFLLSEVYLRNDKVFEARKTLKAARKLTPLSGFLSERLIDCYNRSDNETLYSKEIAFLKENDPENIISINYAMKEAEKKEDYDAYEELLKTKEKLVGETEEVYAQRIGVVSFRKEYDKIIKLANAAFEKYPENYQFNYLKYVIEKEANKNIKGAINILEQYQKRNFNIEAQRLLSQNYIEMGDKEKGLKAFSKVLENLPYATGFYHDMAELYYKMQNYEKALFYLNKSKDLAPYRGTVYHSIGEVYSAMGQDEKAKQYFNSCLTFSPNNYDVRKKLRKLEGKINVYDYFKQPDVYAAIRNAPKAESYPEDNSVILVDEQQKIVYSQGVSEQKIIFVVKVFNSEGINTWKEYSIPYNSYSQRLIIEKAEVVKKNGNKIDAEKDDNYIVFTSLEPEDAIHVSYRIENYQTGNLAKHFWDKFYFNSFIPSISPKYSLLIAKDKKFNHKVINCEIAPKVTAKEEFDLYEWEAPMQESLKSEGYMPPLTDIGKVLFVSSISDWNFVSQWYSDLSTIKSKSDYEVKEVVSELFPNPSKAGNELEKAKIIYEYIEKNIRYSSLAFRQSGYTPQKASKTINTKLGDCKDLSTLFVAIANEVGLKANLVLVNTRDNGEKDMVLPSVDFNHCIVKTNLDGKDYFVELTADKLPFASMLSSLNKAQALNIPRDHSTSELFQITSANRPANNLLRTTEVNLSNNDLLLSRKNIKTGAFALYTRDKYFNLGKEAIEKKISEEVGGSFNRPVKILDFSFTDLDNYKDTITMNYSLNVKNALSDLSGMKIFTLPWTDAERNMNYLSSETRKFPINFWEYDISEKTKEVMTINIPQGKKLHSLPPSQKLKLGQNEYSITYKLEGNKLIATRETNYGQDTIPVDQYDEFREFFNKIIEADSKQLAIQ